MKTPCMIKNMISGLAAILLTACIFCPSGAHAADLNRNHAGERPVIVDGHGTGLLPESEIPHARKNSGVSLFDAETFEEQYNSHEQSWAQNISILDQGKYGLCWAYSTITAAEYSYSKELY